MLWTVFAIRAVDRNNDPTPTIALPPPTTTLDLQATVEFVNRRLFPDRPYPSPVATPMGTPVASTAVSSPAPPDATPLASPATEAVARP